MCLVLISALCIIEYVVSTNKYLCDSCAYRAQLFQLELICSIEILFYDSRVRYLPAGRGYVTKTRVGLTHKLMKVPLCGPLYYIFSVASSRSLSLSTCYNIYIE